MFGDTERARDHSDLTGRQVQGVMFVAQLHQQDKFVTADPRQGVLAAQILAQAQADFPQQQVAHVMAEGIIDWFETVQIDEHQCKTTALLLHLRHGLADAVGQQYPIRQTGQGVVQRQLGEFTIGFGERAGQVGGARLQTRIQNRGEQGDAQHRQRGDQDQAVQALAA
ncbi:hypothetical protein D3C84_751250 [compost metagenome]